MQFSLHHALRVEGFISCPFVHLIHMLYLDPLLLYMQAMFDRLSVLRMEFDGVSKPWIISFNNQELLLLLPLVVLHYNRLWSPLSTPDPSFTYLISSIFIIFHQECCFLVLDLALTSHFLLLSFFHHGDFRVAGTTAARWQQMVWWGCSCIWPISWSPRRWDIQSV